MILMLLALVFLPKHTPAEQSSPRRAANLLIAGAAGIGAGLLAFAIMMRDAAFDPISLCTSPMRNRGAVEPTPSTSSS